MRKYLGLLLVLLASSWMALAQSDPGDLIMPSPEGASECPIVEFSTEEEAQRLWSLAIGSEDKLPVHIFTVYGAQTLSVEEFGYSETNLSCASWDVWQVVNGVLVKVPLDNCEGTPTLTTYATGIYWLVPSYISETITNATDLPPNTLAFLGDDLSGNYSLVAHETSNGVVVDIWDHQEQTYIQMPNDLQGIEPINYVWRTDRSELTILARYTFDQRLVMLNYNPTDRTLYTFIESRNESLACTHLRWLSNEELAIGFNAYFGDVFQALTITFPDVNTQMIDITPQELRDVFVAAFEHGS